ncbi:MAG: 16S rRNA (cytidine(1402)-2'-O)-methyltransferase [Candidatus Omnitrophica bacterium]|nr:16S rRNA (cytidine(1402)-2'-O)-methyltransferase [Candidatus Omnitrophota bacterium]
MPAGVLYLVGTPIGNLGDISERALTVLKKVDWIAAEDTRRTKQMCQRFQIQTPLTSMHEHNEKSKAKELIRRIVQGESGAYVSDAGMPVISDPGTLLVQEAAAAGVAVTVIPGPSALTSALALSGFWGTRFRFEGFPPRKDKGMEEWLRRVGQEPIPVICYESPYRLVKTLQAIRKVLGEIPVAVARELTKIHEEVIRGSTSEVLKRYTDRSPKGECVIVFRPGGAQGTKENGDEHS